MIFLFPLVKKQKESLEDLLQGAQSGDREAREKLISQYQPFILSSASEVCGRYLVMGQDDEVSISLMAFNEAIDSYDKEKQAGFLGFAKTVIKRRLIDYFRREAKRGGEILTSDFVDAEDDKETNAWEVREAEATFRERQAVYERREEIAHYQSKLKEMGISLQEVVACAPKHEDARLRAMELAYMVSSNPLFKEYLQEKKTIPISKLEKVAGCSAKTIERQRKYIIAVALILMGDYHYLRDYIKVPQARQK